MNDISKSLLIIFMTSFSIITSCERKISMRSSNALIEDLERASVDDTVEILWVLHDREIFIEPPRFRNYLSSTDPYIWINAAILLGKNRDPESIPYLIKGLRHYASRSRSDIAKILFDLTDQNLGQDFEKWRNWYLEKLELPQGFDWDSYLSR